MMFFVVYEEMVHCFVELKEGPIVRVTDAALRRVDADRSLYVLILTVT